MEESTFRNELQMQMDSKESDIEQLNSKIMDLQQRMDSTSIASQADETDGNVMGKRHGCLDLCVSVFLSDCTLFLGTMPFKVLLQ